VSDALDLLAGLQMEDGRRWGEMATPEQLADAKAVLDPAGPAMFFHTRPRGGAKTDDLAAVVVVWLAILAAPGARAYGAAADRDQAALLIDSIRAFANRTPGLAGALQIDAWRVTNRTTGATFGALAADGPGAFGLRPALLVIDEVAAWPDTPGPKLLWEALVSSMAKVPGSKLVVLTSAGSPSHWSYRVLQHARSSGQWRTSEWPGPVPWVDPVALEEQRGLLTESQFARLHLNRWTEPEESLATHADVLACASLDGPQAFNSASKPYVIGVDLGVKRDRSVLVVAHSESTSTYWNGPDRVDKGTQIVVDRKMLWRPTKLRPVRLEEVEAAILQAWESYGRPAVVVDPWQAIGLAQRLRERGVRVEEFAFSTSSVGRLAGVLYGLIRDHRLVIDGQDSELVDELASVRLRETTPGTYRLDHGPSGHDDQAVAVALAAQHLLATPQSVARVGHYTAGRHCTGRVHWHGDPDDPDERMLRRSAEAGHRLAITALEAREAREDQDFYRWSGRRRR
jgi:hypothetical protein